MSIASSAVAAPSIRRIASPGAPVSIASWRSLARRSSSRLSHRADWASSGTTRRWRPGLSDERCLSATLLSSQSWRDCCTRLPQCSHRAVAASAWPPIRRPGVRADTQNCRQRGLSSVACQRVVLDEIDLGSVEDAVGVAAYDTGYREMHDGVVRRMEWVPSRRALARRRPGQGRRVPRDRRVLQRQQPDAARPRGYCSCEVGCECKHAAALALAGALASGQDLTRSAARSLPWEQSLTSLIQARPEPAPG